MKRWITILIVFLLVVSSIPTGITAAPPVASNDVSDNSALVDTTPISQLTTTSTENPKNDTSNLDPQLVSPLEQSLSIEPDINQAVVPGNTYLFDITTGVEQGGITKKDSISNPYLNIQVGSDGGDTQPVITGIASGKNDYNRTTEEVSRQEATVSTDQFSAGTVHRTLVRVRIPESADGLTLDINAGRGGNVDLSRGREYITSTGKPSWEMLANRAESRSKTAARLNDGYNTTFRGQSVDDIANQGVKRTFFDVGTFTGELLLGVVPGVGKLADAKTAVDFGKYVNSLKTEDKYDSPWFGSTARAQMNMFEQGFTTADLEKVDRYGYSSYVLKRVEVLAQQEAEAWRNNNRERALDKLRRQREYLYGTDAYDELYIEIPDQVEEDSADPVAAQEGETFNLPAEVRTQDDAAKSEIEFANEETLETARLYLSGLKDFSRQTEDDIKQTIQVAQKPDPRVTLTNEEKIRQELASRGTVEATFEVSNKGEATSIYGFLSLAYSNETLEIEQIEQVDEESDGEVRRDTSYDPTKDESYVNDTLTNTYVAAEDEIVVRGGEQTTLDEYSVTDIFERFDTGETNTYRVVFNRSGPVSEPANITYRTAFQPLIHNDTQSAFVREPTLEDAQAGPQGWAVESVTNTGSTSIIVDGDEASDSAYQNIMTAVNAATDGDRIVVRPGTYRESLTLDKNISLVAPNGATLDGASVTSSKSIEIEVGSGAAPTVEGFQIVNFSTALAAGGDPSMLGSPGTRGDWTIQNVAIVGSDRYAIDATQTTGDWKIQNVTVENSDRGVDATEASGEWTIDNSTITAKDIYAIYAGETDSAWRLTNSTIQSSVGVFAGSSTKDWIIASTDVRGSVDTESADGNWTIRNSSVRGVDAQTTDGDWTIRSTVLREVGVNAEYTRGTWTITNSAFINVTRAGTAGGDVFAYSADPEGDATGNWWGSDGPACQYSVDCSDPLSEPPEFIDGDNKPPIADVWAPATVNYGESVTFDASNSTDPDGEVAKYDWDIDGDGQYERSGVTVSRAWETTGDVTVKLRVTDSLGATDSDNITITVSPLADPVLESLRFNRSTVFDDESVGVKATIRNAGGINRTFDIKPAYNESSSDRLRIGRDQTTVTLAPGETKQISFPYEFDTTPLYRVYNFGLYLHWDTGPSAFRNKFLMSDSKTIDVQARPDLKLTRSQGHVIVGETVSLSLAQTSDADGQLTKYEWDLNMDGTFERSGRRQSVTLTDPGVNPYRVRVVDDEGNAVTSKRSIAVYRPDDWPSAGFNPGHSSWNPHTTGPVQNVEPAWNTHIGYDIQSPVIINQTAYALTDDGKIVGIDKTTGTIEWAQSIDPSITGSPVIRGDTLLIPIKDQSVYPSKSGIISINRQTGEKHWEKTGIGSSPIAATDGFVYTSGGYALNATTGETVWQSWSGQGVAASAGLVFFTDSSSEDIIARHAANGSMAWQTSSPNIDFVTTAPAVSDGTVFLGDKNGTAIDASTGSVEWSTPFGKNTSQRVPPAVTNDMAYFSTTNTSDAADAPGGRLYALDRATGTVEWTATYPRWGRSPPSVAGDNVYVGSNTCEESCSGEFFSPDGKVWAFDADTGDELWNYTTEEYVTTAPAVSNGTLYIGNGSGGLLALQNSGNNQNQPSPSANILVDSEGVNPGNSTYNPDSDVTIQTFHNATGAIERNHVAIRLLNSTNGSNTQIARTDSIPIKGEVNTTLPAGSLSGNVTVEIQLFNTSSSTVVATTTLNLTTTPDMSIAATIDADGDNEIDDTEILTAIDYWQNGESVPHTNGETITDLEILELIETWRDNRRI